LKRRHKGEKGVKREKTTHVAPSTMEKNNNDPNPQKGKVGRLKKTRRKKVKGVHPQIKNPDRKKKRAKPGPTKKGTGAGSALIGVGGSETGEKKRKKPGPPVKIQSKSKKEPHEEKEKPNPILRGKELTIKRKSNPKKNQLPKKERKKKKEGTTGRK